MSTAQWQPRVVPAQLAFLAIYNPSLGGESDESFRDQLVFYYSRAAHDLRVATRKQARNDAAGGDALRAEENEKLRQIGLAQGMVDFAKSFSNGEPVDSIETEKSRIVLHELDGGWWILASIDLTVLPSIAHSSSKQAKSGTETSENEAVVEYSSREVAPPALLIQQLCQAHYIFSLHHGPSLNDLFVRLPRDKFCNTLDRYWTRFARNWDVLLHGNPAADVFSGVKLAYGGELGVGVGEEEWGSGEREVLEDLAHRTDGLVDLVVARFGEVASVEGEKPLASSDEPLTWMGGSSEPSASDGIVFGGVGAIRRHSLRNISLWMRQIYTFGDQAYGVKDNPLRERRKRKRHRPPEPTEPADGTANEAKEAVAKDGEDIPNSVVDGHETTESVTGTSDPKLGHLSAKRPSNHPRAVSTESRINQRGNRKPRTDLNKPKIPPPIVSAAAHTFPALTQQEGQQNGNEVKAEDEPSNALGIPDSYMKYLTFGLSTLGKQKKALSERRSSDANTATSQSRTKNGDITKQVPSAQTVTTENGKSTMTQIGSIPEDERLQSKYEIQKRQESRGHFVIGLKGDLLELDELSEVDQSELSDDSLGDGTNGSRIVLRTIQVEVVPRPADEESDDGQEPRKLSKIDDGPASEAFKHYRRLRVLIYVHRPFMYCFLFEDRTSSLQWTKFYKSLHRNLVPIHKPLLLSTSPENVAQRIKSAQAMAVDDQKLSDADSNKTLSRSAKSSPIYDLIYDPKRLTLHSSIPNIPEPGTPAAEGIFASFKDNTNAAAWTRVEALNVHGQILNTLVTTQSTPGELERTSKTNRGWWIVWMKVQTGAEPDSNDHHTNSKLEPVLNPVEADLPDSTDQDQHRIAFLVRKASDAPAAPKTASTGSRAMSSMLEVMSLGMASREDDATGGVSAGWGPAALAGGIGIDARKYIEGLLSLNR